MFFIKSLVCLREVFRFELFPDFFLGMIQWIDVTRDIRFHTPLIIFSGDNGSPPSGTSLC